ncbi:sodium:solute symporter [Taibaiella koreensis]|uniref:sodium:solute symporter n=1 Tax=Taibaiella koreensis TaxID=1268548 RepID=UPI000E59FBB3|nr:sodium:solute symporter [Taibaiella koreensis]
MNHQQILLTIILAYFLLLLGVAFYTARGSNNESFFVGNRNSKWWLVAFGMIGTSLSGMTFISVPGTVGAGAFGYFQVVIGYWLGYFIVAYVLLPVYYKMQLTSIYTYLEKRLGVNAHKTGAFFFILSRTLGATLRLYLVIKVLELFVLKDLGISFEVTAVVILGLILLYTFKGGVKTIVWTDTLQTTFMLLALIVSLFYLAGKLDFSLGQAWAAVSAKGMTKIFASDPLPGNFFLKQILGGAFITIAMTGLDQEMMQKNISVSNLKDSQKNIVVMGTLQMLVVFIFLFLGGVLVLYASANGIADKGDNLFPAIALQSQLPFFITVCFVIGLISALFPSADGALTALTSSFCIDILGMQKKGQAGSKESLEKRQTRTRLIVHNVFALIFLVCVFFFREVDNGSLIDILLKLAGFTYGPLLGLFAFGILTRRTVAPKSPLIVCLLALCLTLVIDVVNNYQWYAPKIGLSEESKLGLQHFSESIFGQYKIGVELLIVNAAITFLLLLAASRRTQEKGIHSQAVVA